MLRILGLLTLISCASAACNSLYLQCGGKFFNGPNCCQSGLTCKKYNEFYSQCVYDTNGSGSNGFNSQAINTTKKSNTTIKKTTTKITTAKAENTSSAISSSSSSSVSSDLSSQQWPSAQKTVKLSEPMVIKAGQTFDGLATNGVWTSYGRGRTGLGDCKNIEGGNKDAVFRLETGATLKNVILGGDSVEHVHCIGDGCTVENVWWVDVCEDALSLIGSTNKNAKFYLNGGGARNGSDKIVQHNSAGTVYISNFIVKDSGKVYRSCGNCKSGYQGLRYVVLENVTAENVSVVAGINSNFGDTATFKNIKLIGTKSMCNTFNGNNNGKEPTKTSTDQCKSNTSNCVCK